MDTTVLEKERREMIEKGKKTKNKNKKKEKEKDNKITIKLTSKAFNF